MTPGYENLRERAKGLEEENFRFRAFLKHHIGLPSKEVDGLVFASAEKVWTRIDCTACANCCRELTPEFTEKDVARLAAHLGMNESEFTSKYLTRAKSRNESQPVMRELPCPFLKDNLCSVYEHRPTACRGYPYLDKSDVISRTLSMIGRTAECPAVFEVWEELKKATGFRRRARSSHSTE